MLCNLTVPQRPTGLGGGSGVGKCERWGGRESYFPEASCGTLAAPGLFCLLATRKVVLLCYRPCQEVCFIIAQSNRPYWSGTENPEPKQTFTLDKLIASGICYSAKNTATRTSPFPQCAVAASAICHAGAVAGFPCSLLAFVSLLVLIPHCENCHSLAIVSPATCHLSFSVSQFPVTAVF